MAKRTINVTGQDIMRGSRGSFCYCPIALAVGREFRCKAEQVTVGLNYIQIWWAPGTVIARQDIPTPDVAKKFMSNFDRGDPVEPISFDLEVP